MMKCLSDMKTKPKKCKSVNAKTKGLGCGKMSLRRRFGLCDSCYIDWLLKTPEGQKHLERSKLTGAKRVRKRKAEKERLKMKKMKEEVTDYKKLLQRKCNHIARLIDRGQPCLARQTHHKNYDGGHVYSVGANQSMRFNLHNIHRQGKGSNQYQRDDILMRDGVAREYGQDYADFLMSLKSTRPLKFSKFEYIQFYKKACEIVDSMVGSDKILNTQERIEARNKVNIALAIYHLKHSRYEDKDKS